MQTVVIDIQDPASAVQEGVDAACATLGPDDRVVLFHSLYHTRLQGADTHSSNTILGEARDLLIDARKRQLEAIAAALAARRTSCEVHWESDNWQALLQAATNHDATMVVAQSRRQAAGRLLSRANHDWQLIRHCKVPLLLTRKSTAGRYGAILAAVDPLHEDDKPATLDNQILQHASRLALRHGVPLHVLNVVAPIPQIATGTTVPALAVNPVEPERLRSHQEHLKELVSKLPCSDTRLHVMAGIPSQVITDIAAQLHADLVVMGAISRTPIRSVLIGSTAERVLDRLRCDALIVKPDPVDTSAPRR